jgi:hypothetical protein
VRQKFAFRSPCHHATIDAHHPVANRAVGHFRSLQDLDLKSFSKLVCSLLDIPIYDNPVESLHVLFSLYLEFKNNPVFGQQLQGGGETDIAG